MGVSRQGQYYVTSIVTGPQYLRLMLDLADERLVDPYVTAVDVCPVYGCPTEEVVRAAVLGGTDRANAEFGTNLHPLEIRFSYSGWDNERCNIAGWGAYEIVRAIAEGAVRSS